MILGIDASNIRGGGGITHLVEFLENSNPKKFNFTKVIIWASNFTLNQINDKPWLIKRKQKLLNKNLIYRSYWQWRKLEKQLIKEKCSLLFVPGGSFTTSFRPVVTMNQNLLPFEWKEIIRYKISFSTVKFFLLRLTQSYSFRNSNGIIFLSNYSKRVVLKNIETYDGLVKIIPHGLDKRFFLSPQSRESLKTKKIDKTLKIIYVSSIEPYKHQWNVVKAVASLISKGFLLELILVGPSNQSSLKKLTNTIKKYKKYKNHIKYYGQVGHDQIQKMYSSSDIAVFASSCETFGQILIEGMASSLPTACSEMSSMPEILNDSGIYFDPLNPKSIELSLYQLINSTKLRSECSIKSFSRAQNYSWEKCSNNTFQFFQEIAKKKN